VLRGDKPSRPTSTAFTINGQPGINETINVGGANRTFTQGILNAYAPHEPRGCLEQPPTQHPAPLQNYARTR
jgi:hypothetical protein